MRELLIFDGDDTLWEVELLYDEARIAAGQVVSAEGLDGKEWDCLERAIDLQAAREVGFSDQRFARSCMSAYELLARDSNREVRTGVLEQIRSAALEVFTRKAPLVPEARAVLQRLKRESFFLVLLTQGSAWVQEKRIADSGLADTFDLIRIVDRKVVETFREIVAETGFQPGSSWSIGNSLPSDINPALIADMNAIWIPAHVWEFERRETEPVGSRVDVIGKLSDVPDALAATRARLSIAE